MQNTRKLFGLNAVIASIVFAALSLTGCDNGTISTTHVHQWGAWTVTTPATCTTAGVETRVCTLDATHKETRPIAIDPRAHQWGDWTQTKAPTETEDGEETKTCAHNAEHKETRSITALGHTHQWGEWTVTTAPTCTTVGEETRTCAFDGTIEKRPIVALGHDWEWIVTTPATYTAEGEETRTCTLDATHKETRAISRIPFTSVASLGTWLTSQPANTATTAFKIVLNVSDLGGDYNTDGSVGKTLIDNPSKYISLDLSGSTFTSIGENAFYYYCTSLTSINIPNGVTSIGWQAFSGCISLTDITIPNSVTSIGGYAFENTAWFNNQTDGLVYAEKVVYTYKGTMPANTSITLLEGTKGIADMSFYDCTGLTSVTIPDNVITIGREAFRGCGLTSIIIPDSVTSIGTMAFWGCRSLSEVIIGKNITSIERLTFFNCDSLTSVIIPSSVINIERQAFLNCPSLASVTFEGTIPSSGFSDNTSTPPFFGDLRAKFYATDPINGTPGTYITTAPVSSSSVWTKQP